MPLYEYRCSACDSTFELRRPAEQSQAPAVCAEGHVARRKISVFAMAGHASGSEVEPFTGCGDGCACAAGH